MLIRPKELYVAPYNYAIHNISEADLKGQPTLDSLWPSIRDYIGDACVVAHNASFDVSVLRHALADYGIPWPELNYHCTRIIAKASWRGLTGYGLDVVAAHLGIALKHHDAEDDAAACATVMLRAAVHHQAESLIDLCERTATTFGRLFGEGWQGVTSNAVRKATPKPTRTLLDAATDCDTGHPFFGKQIVFTGTLQSMPRSEATQLVELRGGTWADSVTKNTAFLVLGLQDYRRVRGGDKSAKMVRAEQLLAQGHPLEVISEDDFSRLL
jgi:DNA polymerase-3 subunit epsilon